MSAQLSKFICFFCGAPILVDADAVLCKGPINSIIHESTEYAHPECFRFGRKVLRLIRNQNTEPSGLAGTEGKTMDKPDVVDPSIRFEAFWWNPGGRAYNYTVLTPAEGENIAELVGHSVTTLLQNGTEEILIKVKK